MPYAKRLFTVQPKDEPTYTTTLSEFIESNDDLCSYDCLALENAAVGETVRIPGFVGNYCDLTRIN